MNYPAMAVHAEKKWSVDFTVLSLENIFFFFCMHCMNYIQLLPCKVKIFLIS